MNTKEYLWQVKALSLKIDQRQKQMLELESDITGMKSIQYDSDRVQSSPRDSLCERITALISLQADISDLMTEYLSFKSKIIGQIQELSDTRFINLLYKRHIEFKRFEVIAAEMGYDYDWTRQLYNKALQAFSKILKKTHTNTQKNMI